MMSRALLLGYQYLERLANQLTRFIAKQLLRPMIRNTDIAFLIRDDRRVQGRIQYFTYDVGGQRDSYHWFLWQRV
jgi:hypothetical protein